MTDAGGRVTSNTNPREAGAGTGSIRPISTLFASNLLGAIAGGVFFLVASRSFDLEEMGRYAVLISAQWIAVGLLGTGLSVATVRLATDRLLAGERSAAAGVVATSAIIAVAISLSAAGLCLGLAPLSASWFGIPAQLLALVALWAGGRSLLDCVRAGLLAQQQFNRVGLLMVLSASTGLLSLLVVVLTGPLTLERLLVAHVVGLGTAAIVGLGFLVPLASSGIRLSAAQLRALIAYARWPALSEGSRMLQANLGPLLLLTLAGSAQAGLFSLGRYPAYVFEVVAVSLYQYWLPTAFQPGAQTHPIRFLGRQMRLAALLGFGLCSAAVIFRPLLHWLGANFEAAAPLFVLSAIDFAILLLIRPVEALFHGLHRPRRELLLRLGTLPLLVVGGFLLASRFGAEGMLWAHIFTGLAALPLALRLLWGALDPDARRQMLPRVFRKQS
jgi:O-antigen/teichoic acid export membrane protein